VADVFNFYIDDSGTRNPDRNTTDTSLARDWFALGGVLIREADEAAARQSYAEFCEKWKIHYPLHSSEIRHKEGRFRWLADEKTEYLRFLRSLEKFLLKLPVVGLACVIDRPGYNDRYQSRYGRRRWLLCRSAFCIAVERAAKHAIDHGHKLRVLAERCSRKDDEKLKGYYEELKQAGAPFDPATSRVYAPLGPEKIGSTLYEFRIKSKSSPMMQVADMYLWPMCIGGYDRTNHAYQALLRSKKLLECHYDDEQARERGVKYFCFDSVKPKASA
jgi:hypothetical protein